jgi:hypothetical protein
VYLGCLLVWTQISSLIPQISFRGVRLKWFRAATLRKEIDMGFQQYTEIEDLVGAYPI